MQFAVAEHVLGQLLGWECGVRAQVLALLPAVDTEDEPWRVDGAVSLEAWLASRFGLSHRSARELVDVSRRLADLPLIAAAFAEGQLSWDQLRFVVRLADPESDARWSVEAAGSTPEQLERAAKLRERMSGAERAECRQRRSLRWWHSRGMLRLAGELTSDDGEIVTAALSRLAEQATPDPETGMFEPLAARCADALVDVCSSQLADDADADRATVVIYVKADDLVDGDDGDQAETGSGLPVSLEAVRRRCCDARYQRVKVDDCDRPVGIGRVSQIVPPWLRRVVTHRDGGACRFPGCGRRRLVQPHHLWWWSDGGPTDSHNLISLCRFHHRLMHEGGWSAQGNADTDRITWIRPDGSALRPEPPPLEAEIRTRLDELKRLRAAA